MPKSVYCDTCGHLMEEMDYRIVPQIELVYWAKNGSSDFLDKGWFWCAECNFWTHQSTIEMFRELASR